MDEIELKVHDMSSTLQPADAYALVLEEVNGNRKLPIIIGSLEAQAIKVVMMGYKMPRPLTHDLFLTVTKELGTALKKVLIYKVKDGVYYSYLFLEKEGEQLHEVGSTAFSVNVNTVDVVMLKEALSKAIEEENYEQASRLRDEIKRREQEEENTIA